MIRVKQAHNGTYTVYRDDIAVVAELTKAQADEFQLSLSQVALA